MSSSRRKIRLFSDVGAKMSMFNKRAQEHHDSQMINPFSEWSGSGTRRKLSREDPDYGRPVEGSKTAERGRLAQIQMIGDMVELCDMVYDCGIRSPDGRAAISFGDAFRLYSSINDKVVGLLMRGRKHKILDFEGEMLFQGRDEHKMIELLLPLNTIRHKYGMPERAGCGEVDHELLKVLAEQDRKQKQQRKQQRTRSVGVLPPPPPLSPAPTRHQKSRSVDNSWPTSAGEARDLTDAAVAPEKTAGTPVKSGEIAEGAEGGEGQRDVAERKKGSAAGGSIEQQGDGTAAAVATEAEGQNGGAGDRLHQQTSFATGDPAEGHDATGSDRNSEGGQDAISILSQLMRDETLCVDASAEEHRTPSNADEQSRPRSRSPGSDQTHGPPKLCLPEIRIGECHEPSAEPTSADSWPRALEPERAPSVGHGQGQGQGHPSAADLRGCPGLTATDRAEVVTGSHRGPEPEPEPQPTSELETATEGEPDPKSGS